MANGKNDTKGLDRRRFLQVAGELLAAGGMLGFGSGVFTGRKTLDERIRNLESLESDKRFAEGLNALYSFANPYHTENFDSEQALRYLMDSIVIVQDGKDKLSSGVLIGDYVLCTYQGVESLARQGKESSDVNKNELVFHGNNSYGFRLVVSDDGNDLALLQIYSDGFFSPVKVVNNSNILESGREIRLIGVSSDYSMQNLSGKISEVNSTIRDENTGMIAQNKLITDIYAKDLMSGGAIADINGSFLGLMQYKKLPPEEHAVGVGLDVIIPFLLNAAAKESQITLQHKRATFNIHPFFL